MTSPPAWRAPSARAPIKPAVNEGDAFADEQAAERLRRFDISGMQAGT